MARHAQSLGYDAVVLCLDELVLWLASRIATPTSSPARAKVAKPVEAADARRPIPLVSSSPASALKDFPGEHVPGAERLAFGETFRWWEDRFNKITLEDRSLPVIVERRLLKPKPGGKQTIDAAFDKVATAARCGTCSCKASTPTGEEAPTKWPSGVSIPSPPHSSMCSSHCPGCCNATAPRSRYAAAARRREP